MHLHRDIVETIASGASLFAVFRSTYSDDIDPVDVGRFQTGQTEIWFRRAAEFRQSAASGDATFVDVEYRDLVDDPAAVITRVYAAADLEPPDDPSKFIAAYNAAQPHHAHGVHRYRPADFGLDEKGIRERFAAIGS